MKLSKNVIRTYPFPNRYLTLRLPCDHSHSSNNDFSTFPLLQQNKTIFSSEYSHRTQFIHHQSNLSYELSYEFPPHFPFPLHTYPMALLFNSPEISPLAGRHVPCRRAIMAPRSVALRVSSGLKHFDNEVLKLRGGCDGGDGDGSRYELNLRLLYGQVKQQKETTPSPSSRKREEEEEVKKREYYVNTGYAIRTIREEFPEVFYRELSFGIYRDDIVFKDPLNTFAGIENYKSILWALRFNGKIFFKALWVDIVSVWQPSETMIMVRWTVHGIPRVPWESRGRFDGTSEYKLDKDGKIYEHRVHNIAMNGPQKFKVLAVEQFIQSISGSSTPKPTYFEMSATSTSSHVPLELSAIKSYLTSVITSLVSEAES